MEILHLKSSVSSTMWCKVRDGVVAGASVHVQLPQLLHQLLWSDGVEHIGILDCQVGQSELECGGYCIFSGPVGPVCEL